MTKKDFAIALLRGILRIELSKYQKAQSMPTLKRKRKKRAFEESNMNYIKIKLAQDVAAAAANKAPAAPKAPKPEVASGTGPLATDIANNFNPSWSIMPDAANASGTIKVPDYNP